MLQKCTMEWYSAWKTQFPVGFFSKKEHMLNEVFLGLIKVGKIHLRSVCDLLALTNRKTMNAVMQRSRVTNLQKSSTCDRQTKSHWKLHLPLWSFVIWPPFLLLLMCQLLLLSSSHPNPANKNALLLLILSLFHCSFRSFYLVWKKDCNFPITAISVSSRQEENSGFFLMPKRLRNQKAWALNSTTNPTF